MKELVHRGEDDDGGLEENKVKEGREGTGEIGLEVRGEEEGRRGIGNGRRKREGEIESEVWGCRKGEDAVGSEIRRGKEVIGGEG